MIYNTSVKNRFGLQNMLILMLILALILGPRPISGILSLDSAVRFEGGGSQGEAAGAYASAAARLPWMPSLWEQAGKAAFLAGDAQSAILYLNRAAGRAAISRSGWLNLGLAYQQLGDLPSAMTAWEQALPLAEAHRQLAQAQRTAGNFSSAADHWLASLAGEPEDAAALYQLGLLYTATSPSLALPKLVRAAQLDPELAASVQELRTALNTSFLSGNPAYQFLVSGQALASLGQWDLAGEAFRNAVVEDETYAEAWAWWGKAKQQLGQDASQEFIRALAIGPGIPIVQGLYGLFLQGQGKPAEAVAAYQKAADQEPVNPGWQIALGSAFEQSGDLVSAYACFSHAVELAPGDPSTWRAIAAFSVNNNVDVDLTGLPAATRLIGMTPDDWQAYDLAGEAAFLLEDYTSAENYLKKAAQLAPTQAAPALHLGLLYLETGDPYSAASYLSLAKTFDPAGPYGWQAERLLEQMFP